MGSIPSASRATSAAKKVVEKAVDTAKAGADVVLFCVKSTDSKSTAQQIAPFLKSDTALLSLQNGVENAARLAGRRMLDLRRRAKYLLAPLDRGDTLVMHLGMTGRFEVEGGEKASRESGRRRGPEWRATALQLGGKVRSH